MHSAKRPTWCSALPSLGFEKLGSSLVMPLSDSQNDPVLFLKSSLEYQVCLNRSTWSSMYWLIPRRWNDIVDSKERDPIKLSSTLIFGLLLAGNFKYFMKLIVFFGQCHIQRIVKQINICYYDFLKLPYDLIERLPFFFFFWSKGKSSYVGNVKRISIKLFQKDRFTADFIQLVLFYVAPLLEKVIPYTKG